MLIRKSYFIIFVVHEVLAFINSFVFNLKGADVDATRFQEKAIEFIKYNQSYSLEFDAEFYIQFLSVIFRIFGQNEFIATQFNILSTLVSIGLVEKISISFLNHQMNRFALYLIFLYPTYLPKVTTTMRESFMLMFFLLLIYAGLKTYGKLKSYLISLLGIFFHKLYVIAFPTMIVFLNVFKRLSVKRIFLYTFFVLITLSLVQSQLKSINKIAGGLVPLITVISGDVDKVEQVLDAKSSKDARATYGSQINVSNGIVGIIISIPIAMLYYLFLPTPWMISGVPDLLAFGEVFIRLLAVILILLNIKNLIRNKNYISILIFVLIMISLWSIGTTNYGTASRHNITTNWFFILSIDYILNNGRSINYRAKKIRNNLAL